MRILHTSDWHIGRSLYGRKRYEEMEAFLSWLVECLEKEDVQALLVAGDVFDSTMPGTRAQELYYRFLFQVAQTSCRHVVVIAGNHDSPSFLNAPRQLLRELNVHVVGCPTDNLSEEVLSLHNNRGEVELIVCAVPYLRDRDIRTVEVGESPQDKEKKLIEGITSHYRAVCALAQEVRAQTGSAVPVVVMGHLFTTGGREGEGVRELYVGSLARVGVDIFPAGGDYVALGHLHVPQRVGGLQVVRYSGSPLPMGFGEAAQKKQVLLVDFTVAPVEVTSIPVPVFQVLERIRGDWQTIAARIKELKRAGSAAWLEITYEAKEIAGNLRGLLDEAVAGTSMEILQIKNTRVMERALSGQAVEETLDDLSVAQVFTRCLEAHKVPLEQRSELIAAYNEVVASVYEMT